MTVLFECLFSVLDAQNMSYVHSNAGYDHKWTNGKCQSTFHWTFHQSVVSCLQNSWNLSPKNLVITNSNSCKNPQLTRRWTKRFIDLFTKFHYPKIIVESKYFLVMNSFPKYYLFCSSIEKKEGTTRGWQRKGSTFQGVKQMQ